jgi:hypothetical protein
MAIRVMIRRGVFRNRTASLATRAGSDLWFVDFGQFQYLAKGLEGLPWHRHHRVNTLAPIHPPSRLPAPDGSCFLRSKNRLHPSWRCQFFHLAGTTCGRGGELSGKMYFRRLGGGMSDSMLMPLAKCWIYTKSRQWQHVDLPENGRLHRCQPGTLHPRFRQ